jgi:hypothetical protein
MGCEDGRPTLGPITLSVAILEDWSAWNSNLPLPKAVGLREPFQHPSLLRRCARCGKMRGEVAGLGQAEPVSVSTSPSHPPHSLLLECHDLRLHLLAPSQALSMRAARSLYGASALPFRKSFTMTQWSRSLHIAKAGLPIRVGSFTRAMQR